MILGHVGLGLVMKSKFREIHLIPVLIFSLLPAIILFNLIIISDVIINTSVFTCLGYYKVVMQVIFGVYILVTTPIIIKNIIKSF